MFNCLQTKTEQKLILTQSMRQSLEILQMPLLELKNYIQEEILSNPLLELEESQESVLHGESMISDESTAPVHQVPKDDFDDIEDICYTWDDFFASKGDALDPSSSILGTIAAPEADYASQLRDQLIGMRFLDESMRDLCLYLIECLDDRGYLDFPIDELACEYGTDEFSMTQALYIVQGLEPIGVGARSVQECLMLQLAQTDSFNSRTLHLVKDGLPLLARNDIVALSSLLGCSKDDAKAAADCVRKLNPIPFRGYGSAERTGYQIPEAYITFQGGTLQVEWNHFFLPNLTINQETEALLRSSGTKQEIQYLNEKSTSAKQLIHSVENRGTTLQKILQLIIRWQHDYFTGTGNLRPMTMGQLAGELSLNISTISRALQGKHVSFNGQSIPIKKLFVNTIESKNGTTLSSCDVKQQIKMIVHAEDRANPLSDQAICMVLEAKGLPVSRRTVAKYREELGIPSSLHRRQR